MTARALGVLVLLAALPAGAGERFYPVMGPDGRMQMIRSEAPEPAPAASPSTADSTTGSAPGPARTADAGVDAAPAAAGFAPYDSDAYADSESVEAAVARESAGKSRFYVIDDGMGSRLTEAPEDAGVLLPPAWPVLPAQETELSYPLPAALADLDGAAARQRFPGLPACLSKERLGRMPAVASGQPATLVLNKGIYLFLDDSRLVEGYRVGGEGPRTLVLRSFSRTDRNPAFAHPHLAFLDAGGCLTRVVTGYYDRLYPSTDDRHSMLRGDVLVHTEEAWMLVLASRGSADIAATLPYGYSPYGQLKFTLKK